MHQTTDVRPLVLRDGPAFGRIARAALLGITRIVDVVIAVYAFALAVIVLFGGADFGLVSLTNPAKPVFILAILVPCRLALPGEAWFVRGWHVLAEWYRGRLADVRARVTIAPAIVDVAFALIVTRAFSWAVAFLANLLLTPARARALKLPFESQKFVEIFAAWDSGWYFDIARRGYYFRPDGESSIAFFPLYPTLMSALAWPFGGSEQAIWTAGIVISLSAFAAALVALHRLVMELVGDRETARRTVLYVAVFPFSLFFTRVYAESLFLLTSVLAVAAAYRGRWRGAGLWGALAALTRPNGILVLVPLALLAISKRPAPRELLARALPLLLVSAAFAGHCAYVYSVSGDPFAWLAAQAHWRYSLGHPPWHQLLAMMDRLFDYGAYDYFFVTPLAPFRLLHGTVALVFLALTPGVFRRFGAPLGAYVLISLLIPLTSDALEGIGRYAAVLFPAFILVATFKAPRLHEGILIASALLLALLNCLFVTLHPIY